MVRHHLSLNSSSSIIHRPVNVRQIPAPTAAQHSCITQLSYNCDFASEHVGPIITRKLCYRKDDRAMRPIKQAYKLDWV